MKTAGMMGVPTLIQEQNSYAGVTNKLLAQKAKVICVASVSYTHLDVYKRQGRGRQSEKPVDSQWNHRKEGTNGDADAKIKIKD